MKADFQDSIKVKMFFGVYLRKSAFPKKDGYIFLSNEKFPGRREDRANFSLAVFLTLCSLL
jgi:hypothetical protein